MNLYHRCRWLGKRAIDATCFLLLAPSFLRPKKEIKKESINKILLINLQGIGDIIETTPLITELRKEFPSAEINHLCYKENGALLEKDPRINNVIKRQEEGIINNDFLQTLKEIRKNNYDLIINIFPAQHSALVTVLSNAKYEIGNLYSNKSTSNNLNVKKTRKTWNIRENCKNIAEQLQIQIKDPYQPTINLPKEIERRGKEETKEKYIIINPEAQWVAKQWPNENWQSVIKQLLKENKQDIIKIIGTQKEKAQHLLEPFKKEKRIENCIGKYTLQELVVIIKHAKLMITTDSGPMHIALAMKTKTIGLFGCTDPEILVKGNKYIEIVSSYKSCPKYLQFNHNNEPEDKKQVQMRKISVEQVLEKVRKVF